VTNNPLARSLAAGRAGAANPKAKGGGWKATWNSSYKRRRPPFPGRLAGTSCRREGSVRVGFRICSPPGCSLVSGRPGV
jgi:hypothetical protein